MKFVDIRSKSRGNLIRLDYSKLCENETEILLTEYNEKYGIPNWIYCDTLESINDKRPCAKCGVVYNFNTPDPCIGYLDGVTGACCGHGDINRQYINLEDGRRMNLEEYYKIKI